MVSGTVSEEAEFSSVAYRRVRREDSEAGPKARSRHPSAAEAMPGRLRVTVLEAAGLPPRDSIGSREFVSVKVSLGEHEFATRHKRLHEGQTAPWNSDFSFPVLNFTDKLLVAICDAAGEIRSRLEIDVSTVLQAGSCEEFAPLDGGGHIHLKLIYVLTNEERKRLHAMRRLTEYREFRKRRDDMRRAYDYKRKEDLCRNNGLRTINENSRLHMGEPLDNWEVFTTMPGKEVSSDKLFALPLPLPKESQSTNLVSLETEQTNLAEFLECEKGSNGETPWKGLELPSPRDVTSASDLCSTIVPDKVDGEQQDMSRSLLKSERLRSVINSSTDNSIPELKPDPLLFRASAPQDAGKYGPSALSQSIGESEKVGEDPSGDIPLETQSNQELNVCCGPEMEKCVEVPIRFQDPMSNSSEARRPSPSKTSTQARIFSDQSMDATASRLLRGSKEDRTTAAGATSATVLQQQRQMGDIGSCSNGSHSLRVPSAAEMDEAQENSLQAQLKPNGRDTFQQTQSRDQNSRQLRMACKLPVSGMKDGHSKGDPGTSEHENGMQQQDGSLRPSTPLKVGRISRPHSLPVRVKTNAYLSPEQLHSNSASSEFRPETLAPVDSGWICVEHPPTMTWEDALKIAQKAKDTGLAANSLRVQVPALLAGQSLPSSFHGSSPFLPKAQERTPFHQAGHGTLLSKLPLPPDYSVAKRRATTTGNVTASVTDLGTQIHLGSQPPAFEVNNENPPLQPTTSVPGAMNPANINSGEVIKKDRRDGTPEDLGQGVLPSGAETRNMAPILEVENVKEIFRSSRNGLGHDSHSQEKTMDNERSQSAKKAEGYLQTPNGWRLPTLEDVNVEAMQNQLLQDSLTEKEFVCAVGGRDMAPDGQDDEEGSNSKDDIGLRTNSGQAVPLEVQDGTEEKNVVTEGLRIQDEQADPKDLALPRNSKRVHIQTHEKPMPPKEPDLRTSKSGLKLDTFNAQSMALSGDLPNDWKRPDDIIHSKRKHVWTLSIPNGEPQQNNSCGGWVSSNALQKVATETHLPQAADGMKSSPKTEIERSPSENGSDGGDPSSEKKNKIIPHLGGAMKQILGGAVILVGVLAFWPKNSRPMERFHTVRPGETLNSIAPGQYNDPSSHFCRMNPRICDHKAIYPGQRLRLS